MNRLRALAISVLCGLATSAPAAGQAALTGHVVITKVLTKKRITLPSYQFRGVALDEPEPASGSFSINELTRVVIYLEGAGLRAGTPAQATLTQKNRRFEPEIVVVPVGSTVSFPNADPIFHNVFSLSKAMPFDLGYYPAGETRAVRFDRPGVVQVYCHLHADMSAAILVLPTARWARLEPDGSFSLPGVPAGSYTLVAWHRSAGFFRRQVTLHDGEVEAVDLVIPVRTLEGGAAAAGASGR